MRASGCGSSALTNCGRNAKKKIDSFGLRMLIRTAETYHLHCRARCHLLLHPQRALLLQRAPGHVEQIGHAEVLQVWNASALVCSSAARPVIAAAMCGTMPSVQPNAATTLGAGRAKARPPACRARRCRARPTTMSDVIRNSMLSPKISTLRTRSARWLAPMRSIAQAR